MYSRSRSARKIPKQSRTLPVKGKGEDAGKYYRCWNCGMVCDSDREALSGSEGGDGLSYEDFAIPSYGALDTSDPLNSVAVMRGNGETVMVALPLGSDGDPKQINHNIKPVVVQGCPFCGTKNWRGDY